MPRSSSYNPTCSINFQTDVRTRDALHALARRQERTASALIRIAVRALLAEQASEQPQQDQQHGEHEMTA
jgi:hypothetical protein